MSTVIIQPDAKLLEELIGTEATLQLRQGIVETFAERHLKSVANSEAMKKRLDELKRHVSAEMDDQIAKQIGKVRYGYGSSGGMTLADSFKDEIKKHVDQMARQAMIDLVVFVQEKGEEILNQYKSEVDARVAARVDKAIETHIQNEVARRLTLVVQSVGKEK